MSAPERMGDAFTLENDGWGEHWIAKGGVMVCDYDPALLCPEALLEVLSAVSARAPSGGVTRDELRDCIIKAGGGRFGDARAVDLANAIFARLHSARECEPIPMVLHCPACGLQHIDAPHGDWTNPPHRSHLCGHCGHVWRPADVPTMGVQATATHGQADSPLAAPARPVADGLREALADWTPHLETERLLLCHRVLDDDGPLAVEVEAALTFLGDVVCRAKAALAAQPDAEPGAEGAAP